MKFPDDAPVTAEKKAALRERLARLAIDLAAVDEQAIRGSGPGGQKKNKTSSGVLLRYPLPRTALALNSGGGSGGGSSDGSSDGDTLGSAPAGRPADGRDDEPARLLVVRCSRERQHSLNRFLALRELADAVEQRVSPETSARLQEIARRRKQKARQASRSRQRAHADAAAPDQDLTAGPDTAGDATDDEPARPRPAPAPAPAPAPKKA